MIASKQKPLYLTLFFTSTALLSYEIFLTRIISAMFLKYFSVLAISVTMAGLGMGGMLVQVYLKGKDATRQAFYYYLSALCLCTSLIIIPIFFSYVRIPSFVMYTSDLFMMAIFIGLCIMPFFWGGIILVLAYQYNADQVHRIYLFDLLGAASGCLLALFMLNQTDGFSAVLFSAVVGIVVLLINSVNIEKKLKKLAWGVSLLIVGLFVFNHLTGTWKLPHPSGRKDALSFEKWSEFGLTTIAKKSRFSGRGVSQAFEPLDPNTFKVISQDYNSSTHVVNAGMAMDELEKIKRQIACFPLLFKESPQVLVLGAGGGKDVFAALLAGSPKVTAVEFNRTVVNDIMQKQLYDFSGGLYDRKDVEVIVDEARNYLTRSKQKFDVILPVSGATPRLLAAGCYGFSTEYLQTREAYRAYLKHLHPKGVFATTFSFDSTTVEKRFQPPYRILATIKEMLQESGRQPKEHIMIIGGKTNSKIASYDYTVCVVFSPDPFSRADARRAAQIAGDMGFGLIFSPYHQAPGLLSRFLLDKNNELFYRHAPLNIRPVSDDNPFYYNHLKPEDWATWSKVPAYLKFMAAIVVIFFMYLMLLIILPISISAGRKKKEKIRIPICNLLYFASLGLGFISIELTLMQRVSAFIGIPSYGFFTTVCAFTLSMGFGSLVAGKLPREWIKRGILLIIMLLSVILVIYHQLWPVIIINLAGWNTAQKITLSMIMLCPIGLLTGMPFVFGIRLLEKGAADTVAWMWAINATTSTMGSVLVTLAWLLWGYTKTTTLGWGFYLAAGIASCFMFPARSLSDFSSRIWYNGRK